MRFSTFVAAAVAVSFSTVTATALPGTGAAAVASVVAIGTAAPLPFITEVVSSFETYCPGPTTVTHGSSEYTVSEATTLTITDCPCTVTRPGPAGVTPSGVVPAPGPYQNGTSPSVAGGTTAPSVVPTAPVEVNGGAVATGPVTAFAALLAAAAAALL